jgi:hypothetical protein
MLSYKDFLNEFKAQVNSVQSFGGLHGSNDEDVVGFRKHMLDVFMPKVEGDEAAEKKVNDIVSTYCIAINKELRFDEGLLKELASLVGMEYKDLIDKMSKETDKYYEGFRGNLVGMS